LDLDSLRYGMQPHRNHSVSPGLSVRRKRVEAEMGRGLLLWLIGIPLPIILVIWLFGGLS